MLKWLVNKPPSGDQENHLVTDDPLATISKGRHKHEIIYAVSRVNPLFQEEEETEAGIPSTSNPPSRPKNLAPESPPTDRESVRSSGYGSKEADSVSYQSDPEEIAESKNKDPIYGRLNLKSPGTVSQLRESFEKRSDALGLPEVALLNRDSQFVKSIEIGQKNPLILEPIPEASFELDEDKKWPSVPHLAKALQRETDRISQRRAREDNKSHGSSHGKGQILRFNPLVSVVAQDGRYVTAISVSPNSKAAQKRTQHSNPPNHQHPPKSHLNFDDKETPSYFKNTQSYNHEFPLLSLQPDSLVTEDTLRMMNYNEHPLPHSHEPPDRQLGPDMPDFGKAMYSSFYSTSTSRESVASSGPFRSQSSSINSLSSGRKKGPSVVQDLWERSGLKTNGRKFLVDVNEIIHNRESASTKSVSPDSQEAIRSFPSSISMNPFRYVQNKNSDDNISSHYYYTPSSGNYEHIHDYQMGLDNPAFIDDNSKPSNFHTKPGPSFQHSLTNFQKRVSERGQRSSNENDVIDGNTDINSNSIKKDKKYPKPYQHPGKAVREFGLTDTDWRRGTIENNPRPWSTSMSRQQNNNFNLGYQSQDRYWNNYTWRALNSRDTSLSSFISPHPNGGGALYQPSGIIQDFTIDAYKLQKLKIGRIKKKHRRRCMTTLLIILGLACFIGAIVGISLYLTNGERMFGAM